MPFSNIRKGLLKYIKNVFCNMHICSCQVSITFYEKYSDMLNMKALVGIRIIFMGKEFE